MNKILNKFLFNREKFMPELHLEQSGFTYSACEPFTKHCERKYLNYTKLVWFIMQHILRVNI